MPEPRPAPLPPRRPLRRRSLVRNDVKNGARAAQNGVRNDARGVQNDVRYAARGARNDAKSGATVPPKRKSNPRNTVGNLMTGQHRNPLRVVMFNTDTNRAEDVSHATARGSPAPSRRCRAGRMCGVPEAAIPKGPMLIGSREPPQPDDTAPPQAGRRFRTFCRVQ